MGKDLTGQKFSRLTALNKIRKSPNRSWIWLCQCECGTNIEVVGSLLVNGHTKSCGCLLRELLKARSTKHGYSGKNKDRHPLYVVWSDIVQRCTNPKNTNYHNYGAKGVSICNEWRTKPLTFIEYWLARGWRKGLEIDRFPNQKGNYCPENCKLSTRPEQTRNTSRNHLVNVFGETLCITDAAKKYSKANYSTIIARINRGWDIETAILTPPGPSGKRYK